MKKGIFLLFLFFTTKSFSQNEFAASAFFNDFKKVLTDAQAGFPELKGVKRKSVFEEFSTEYTVKLMLPLADSGKIVVPVSGDPYVIFYFEPDKVRLKVDQRAINLMDAVILTYDKPLYARMETSIVNENPLTNSLFFTTPDENRWESAVFRTSIYYSGNKYFLSFVIMGKKGN